MPLVVREGRERWLSAPLSDPPPAAREQPVPNSRHRRAAKGQRAFEMRAALPLAKHPPYWS